MFDAFHLPSLISLTLAEKSAAGRAQKLHLWVDGEWECLGSYPIALEEEVSIDWIIIGDVAITYLILVRFFCTFFILFTHLLLLV